MIHYNCFSRTLDVLINRIFGIPVLSYCDDFGPFFPATVAPTALAGFTKATEILKSHLKTIKSRCDRSIEFIGLTGDSPRVETGALLRIFLHQEKFIQLSSIIDGVILIGRIQRNP